MGAIHGAGRRPDLDSVKPQIRSIRRAFGSPSVSCGVLHEGDVIFRDAEGFADVEAGLVPDADTVYPVASCTKAFVAATCAKLVQEGLLSWEAPVSSYLPEFQTAHNEVVGRCATLVDLCSHTTGLSSMDHAILGFHDEFYNDAKLQVEVASNLPAAFGFRTSFSYNNLMYGVVGEVIAKVCGQSAGSVMADKIFKPLGLSRTCTSAAGYPADGNVAKGYSVLDNGSFLILGDPKMEDGGPLAGAGCVRSSVNDMLRWAKVVMQAEAAQGSGALVDDSDNLTRILPGVAFTRSAVTRITSTSTDTPTDHTDLGGGGENSYGLGWFRHTIPSRWLGFISPNFMLLPDPPVIGEQSRARLAISHHGAFGGFVTAFYTFPDTNSAIVVMANSSPSRGDPTDLIAQSLCQELFDMQPRVALETAALKAAETSSMIWPALVRNWVVSRGLARSSPPASAPPVADFIGSYKHRGYALQIDVFALPAKFSRGSKNGAAKALAFSVNGQSGQRAILTHYQHDMWTFLPKSRDDACRRGMELYMSLSSVLFLFGRDASGRVSWLDWDFQGECQDEPGSTGTRFERVR